MATYRRISAKQWENWLRMNFVVVDEEAIKYLAKNMEDVAYMSYQTALSEIVDVLTEGVDGDTLDFALGIEHIITLA